MNMEVYNYIFAIPLGIIALFFGYIGWRRGNRFNFHNYQGNKKERLRDNFFSSFTIITALGCIFPILFPINMWSFSILVYLLLIGVITPISMLGAYWSYFLANAITSGRYRTYWGLGQSTKDLSVLEWYEYTPFAFVGGWIIYYLVYLSFVLALGYEVMSDSVPAWIVFTGFGVGSISAGIATLGIKGKFNNI